MLLRPGRGNETNQLSEIEVLVNLGDASDEVVVIGGDGDDTFTAGIRGVALNTDNDVDVEFAQAYLLELQGNGGADLLVGSRRARRELGVSVGRAARSAATGPTG